MAATTEAGAVGEEQVVLKARRLGRSGLKVSELVLGTMTFDESETNSWGMPAAAQDDAFAMMTAYAEAGGFTLDTADIYGAGASERVVGRWLAAQEEPDKFVVATKVWGEMGKGPNDKGLGGRHIAAGVRESLKRLQLEKIDLYQAHNVDPETPLEETLVAFDDLVRQGLVGYVGVSNFPAYKMAQAAAIAERLGLSSRLVSLQPKYNLLARTIEWDCVPYCVETGMGILPWSPLLGGWLAGKYSRDAPPADGSRVAWAEKVGWDVMDYSTVGTAHTFDVVDKVKSVAAELGRSPSQVSLRWLMQKPGVTAPIIGASKMAHLLDNLQAASFELSGEHMAALDEVSAVPKPYPWNAY
ncbi:aldo/keto reductase [Thecamonas trahens ATCC 50062]|uniref:Aldo/keto reductase n=1 Tax=Thecamonas trahens ATCC 50062 TaxID=461836 RepID=A0A0L0DVC1_THETB|nr:aldo/keto reductase [Thecamonas trahens ATCC 50062]KNC56102.1 aldo/keto reductase [Thecamonas trahens ATCC 50062]|eukprot:XP_013761144.1 aldo/keto reductase [Thecamonas trahens ATCC 50062]